MERVHTAVEVEEWQTAAASDTSAAAVAIASAAEEVGKAASSLSAMGGGKDGVTPLERLHTKTHLFSLRIHAVITLLQVACMGCIYSLCLVEELAKEELNWITTSVPRAHHTHVAAGWIPGHWIHNAPTSSRFCVGITLRKGQRLPTISILWNMIAKQFTLKPRVEAQEIVTATRAVELTELYQLLKTSWKLA